MTLSSAGGALMRTAVCGVMVLLCTARVGAQQVQLNEVELLKEEQAKEAAGDMAGAQRILTSILDANPGSLSAIIALERLARIQNELPSIIPYIQQLLATDPTSPIGHQMLIRTYSNLNRLEDLEQASEVWIKATPRLETPYREIARVLQQRKEHPKALQVLERGRARIGRPDALALELGDTYIALGDPAKAVKEWERAIGLDARGFLLVQRRVAALSDGGARVLAPLIDALTRNASSIARQRAAVTLAIEAGLEHLANPAARRIAATLKTQERQSFLVEVARRADNVKMTSVAYWAYAQILAAGAPAEQMLAIRSRIAELALAVGDTIAARLNYAAIERAYPAGTAEHRQAVALRIELSARDGKLDEALSAFETFRKSAVETPELERAASSIAGALLDRDQPAAAEQLLAGVSGPRASLVRGRIALRQGDMPKALTALMTAAPALYGAEAMETIALITLVGRLSPNAGKLLGDALAKAWGGDRKAAVLQLDTGSAALVAEERAAILDYAAGLADRAELPVDAERIRHAIVRDFAQTLEAPVALLALARYVLERPGGEDEARELLERLILDYPRSALVPQARRELDLLHSRAPAS